MPFLYKNVFIQNRFYPVVEPKVTKIKSAPTEVSAPKNANPDCRYTKPDKTE